MADLMWLKASKPELMKGVDKIEKETKLTTKLLKTELVKSAKAIENLLKEGFEEGKIKRYCMEFGNGGAGNDTNL